MRTIKASSGRFTHMTTFGHRIAAACDDGTVGIYNSVTGALRLSLSPGGPVKAVRGSQDGSALFCAHQGPSVTVWDIQTGGMIHNFPLKGQAECIAICSEDRYLACGLSDGSVKVWEIASQKECAAFGSGSHVTHLCWLKPGEQLVVARGTSTQVWDVVGRAVLRNFGMQGPVCGVVYVQKLDRFAIAATSETESVLKVIDPQTGASFTNRTSQRISCLAFSPITEELVCGMETPGLELFNVPERSWRQFGHPAAITSVSMLSSGTVVANVTGSGIQLLSLDDGHALPQQPVTSVLTVHTLDEGNIVAILPMSRDHITLLESTTMSSLLTIPVRTHEIPTDRSPILCASLKHRIAACCFEDGSITRLELWRFDGGALAWATRIWKQGFVGGISPGGSWLVAIDDCGDSSCIWMWDTKSGRSRVSQVVAQPWPGHPLEIKFESEDQFYSRHDASRLRFVISDSSIDRHEQLPLVAQSQGRYDVDDSREWVIRSSKRVCWIPPGYISSIERSYCWAGNALVMSGQDGVLRKLTFREPF